MKRKRYLRTLVCLALGVVVLTGAAFANYDNASGYTMLKNGIKDMLYEENFSATVDMGLSYNGTLVESGYMEYMYDRNGAVSSYTKSLSHEDEYVTESWTQNDFSISAYQNGDYNVGPAYSKGFNDDFLGGSTEDKDMTEKVINFVELLADTFVGDLKNNFVLTDSANGESTYRINLQGEQIPELVNAGLSLIFSSISYSSSNVSYVTFEDYSIYNDMSAEEIEALYDKSWEIIDKNGGTGIVCIMPDGSVEYYATEAEYYNDAGYEVDTFTSSFYSMLGTEPYIESANCTVTYDSEDRITSAVIEGTLTGYDEAGQKHSFTLNVDLAIYDYGTTAITPFDTSLLDYDWNAANPAYKYFYSDGSFYQPNAEYYYGDSFTIEYGDTSPENVEVEPTGEAADEPADDTGDPADTDDN